MSDQQPDTVELSRRLVYLAAERTLASWIRTALSLMALGFVIDRFGLILHKLPLAKGQSPLPPRIFSAWAGSILIGMGALMALAAAIRYLRFAYHYHRDRSTEMHHGLYYGVGFAALLAVFGVALIVLLTAILG